MKTKWAATPNARKFKDVPQYKINWGSILFITVLLLVLSCSRNEDLQTIINDSPIDDNNPPIDDDNPPNDTSSKIIYTDIEPDFTSANIDDFYNLDLNNDGTVDFTFKNITDTWAFWAEPNSNTNGINAFVAVSGPFWSYTVPISKHDVISSMLNGPYFYDRSECLLIMEFCDTLPLYCSYGWQGKIDYYVGLRVMIKDQTHYAWVRLDVTSSDHWVIKDYAYNATPNNPILAGQKE
ncbi:hypothetical protein ACS386_13825 [Flavobacteriaceae bacterium LMO-SS05]